MGRLHRSRPLPVLETALRAFSGRGRACGARPWSGRVPCKQQGICRATCPGRDRRRCAARISRSLSLGLPKARPEGSIRVAAGGARTCRSHANARRLWPRRSGHPTCALKNRSRAGPRSARNSNCGFSPTPPGRSRQKNGCQESCWIDLVLRRREAPSRRTGHGRQPGKRPMVRDARLRRAPHHEDCWC
jgi:hypothetical protein